LAVAEIELPPLRMRPGDISLLAYQFVKDFGEQLGKQVFLSAEASNMLMDYSWPGNVRELQNIIQLSMIQCRDSELLPRHLPDYLDHSSTVVRDGFPISTGTTKIYESETEVEHIMPLEEHEQQAIIKALRATQGKVTNAAALLGISRATLYRKMKKSGISSRRSFFDE
jgi:DNA-binding NtrC family response regulator